MRTYSTYEAKARFSEVMRKVRAGLKVVITYRGAEIAEIRRIERRGNDIKAHLDRLEEEGVLSPPRGPSGPLRPLAKKPGALARFLESRE